MKERPILFSTEMVRAILEGRKSQTRRIMKPQPIYNNGWWAWEGTRPKAKYNSGLTAANHPPNEWLTPPTSPYGIPGDRLWVRETWARTGDNFHDDWPGHGDFYYKADDPFSELEPGSPTKGIFRWRPSIFMPREACRIILEVTNVRVERLNDITDDDAKVEGIDYVVDKITGYCGYNYLSGGYNLMTTPYHGYRSLWESINGEGSWDKNPWVWVITFRRVKQ